MLTGITIMYPTADPHPWQQSVCVRHSHVRGGECAAGIRHDDGGRRASGFAVYAEQFMGSASVEKRETLGRSSRTA